MKKKLEQIYGAKELKEVLQVLEENKPSLKTEQERLQYLASLHNL